MKHAELASLGGKARWAKVKSKKQRSAAMKAVRNGERKAANQSGMKTKPKP